LKRFWSCEPDGSYVVVFCSTEHLGASPLLRALSGSHFPRCLPQASSVVQFLTGCFACEEPFEGTNTSKFQCFVGLICTLNQCPGGRGIARGNLFGGWIISPFSSLSTLSVGTAARTLNQNWPSASLVTNAMKLQQSNGWFEWLKISGACVVYFDRKRGREHSSCFADGLPLHQRVVLAQVTGLRELCEHTSELVRDEKHSLQKTLSLIFVFM